MSTLHRGIIRAYDSVTHKATVQLATSHAATIAAVPVATNIPPAEVIAGRECAVLLFTDDNPDDGVVCTIHNTIPSPDLTITGNLQIGAAGGQSTFNLNATPAATIIAHIAATGSYASLGTILTVDITSLSFTSVGTYSFTAISGAAVPVITPGSTATIQGLNFAAGASLSGAAADATIPRITAAGVQASLFSSTRAGHLVTLMEGLRVNTPNLLGSTAGIITKYVGLDLLGTSSSARYLDVWGSLLPAAASAVTGHRTGHDIGDQSVGLASAKNALGVIVADFATAPAGGGVSFPFLYGATGAIKWGVNYQGLTYLGAFTVANLPAAAVAGRFAFATNGRKQGEGAGLGTGVIVYDDAVAWRRNADDTTVLA